MPELLLVQIRERIVPIGQLWVRVPQRFQVLQCSHADSLPHTTHQHSLLYGSSFSIYTEPFFLIFLKLTFLSFSSLLFFFFFFLFNGLFCLLLKEMHNPPRLKISASFPYRRRRIQVPGFQRTHLDSTGIMWPSKAQRSQPIGSPFFLEKKLFIFSFLVLKLR